MPPPYAKSSAQTLNINEIERQQQELERRAAELDRREQMLNSSTGNIVGKGIIKIQLEWSSYVN